MNQRHSESEGQTVHSKTPILLVGGGFPDPFDLVNFKAKAPLVVAADSGADFCLSNGIKPDFVIGDLDSISDEGRAVLPPEALVHYQDQNLTDFEKCLRLIDAPFVLATGFTNGRLDHLLAVFAVLARRIGPACVVAGSDDLVFAVDRDFKIDLPSGTRLSIFPMEPMQGTSKGLRWPIDDLTIDPLGRLGTSNEAVGPVELTFEKPGTLVLIPREHLDRVQSALVG